MVLLIAGALAACRGPGALEQQGAREKQLSAEAESAGAAEAEQAAAGDGETAGPDGGQSGDSEVRRELPVLMVLQEHPVPGEPLTIIYVPADPVDGDCRAFLSRPDKKPFAQGRFFEYFTGPGGRPVLAALLTVPSTMEPGPALVYVEGGGVQETRPLTVEPREFVSEFIPLNETNTAIRTSPDPQKTKEAELLWSIITRTGAVIYTGGPFSAPVTSTRRTSFFGDRRVFVYSNGKSDSSIHAGIDYGVPAGTDVFACAPGRVVLAVSRIVTGNTVIIEHLPGVYSLYYHMDSILVEKESLVEQGTLLGTSGSTGLATGPHLHWEIRVSGENTDPDLVMLRPLLDKDLILSTITKRADSEPVLNFHR